MASSVLEAIKLGLWDFEPQHSDRAQYDSTEAVPGSDEKLAILAERLSRGLPLWHPADRMDFEGLESLAERGRASANN